MNRCFRYGGAPHVVGAPVAATRSFAPYGTPCNAVRALARVRSARRASVSARSRIRLATALYRGPCVSRSATVAAASSLAE